MYQFTDVVAVFFMLFLGLVSGCTCSQDYLTAGQIVLQQVIWQRLFATDIPQSRKQQGVKAQKVSLPLQSP